MLQVWRDHKWLISSGPPSRAYIQFNRVSPEKNGRKQTKTQAVQDVQERGVRPISYVRFYRAILSHDRATLSQSRTEWSTDFSYEYCKLIENNSSNKVSVFVWLLITFTEIVVGSIQKFDRQCILK